MSVQSIAPETLAEKLRVHWKRWSSRLRPRRSFCKKCGRDQRDFIAPERAWGTVEPHIRYGNVLCYDCFFEAYWKVTGAPVFWSLTDSTVPVVEDVVDGVRISARWSP